MCACSRFVLAASIPDTPRSCPQAKHLAPARVKVDAITNAVHGNDNVSNIGSVLMQNATAGTVDSSVSGGRLEGEIRGNDNRLNIGSVQLNDAHRGEVTTKTDLNDVSVSISGDNTDIAVDSVVIE